MGLVFCQRRKRLNQQPEGQEVLFELDNEQLVGLLREKERLLKEVTSRGMAPELKEIWAALTRLRDRVDNLEQLMARSSNLSSEQFNYMHETLQEYHVRLFGEGTTE